MQITDYQYFEKFFYCLVVKYIIVFKQFGKIAILRLIKCIYFGIKDATNKQ